MPNAETNISLRAHTTQCLTPSGSVMSALCGSGLHQQEPCLTTFSIISHSGRRLSEPDPTQNGSPELLTATSSAILRQAQHLPCLECTGASCFPGELGELWADGKLKTLLLSALWLSLTPGRAVTRWCHPSRNW